MALTPPPASEPVPVALLCAVRLYREGLAAVVDECPDFDVIVSEDPARVTAASLRDPCPQIIVVEIGTMSRRQLTDLRELCGDVAIVAFAVREVPEDILACVEAGAAAFVTTGSTAEELVDVLRSVRRGGLSCSERSAGILYRELQRLQSPSRRGPHVEALTFREREVFDLVCQGMRNQEIADSLNIQLATVKNHVHRILEKLHVRSRTEAASYGSAPPFAPR